MEGKMMIESDEIAILKLAEIVWPLSTSIGGVRNRGVLNFAEMVIKWYANKPASLDSTRHEATTSAQNVGQQESMKLENTANCNQQTSLYQSLLKEGQQHWRVTLTFSDDCQCIRTIGANSPMMAYTYALQDARMGSESSPQYTGDVVNADILKLNTTTGTELKGTVDH